MNAKGRKLGFLICGAQKGGTTALDAYLREHPEICMANRKEVHFFDNEVIFKHGNPDYSIYHSLFNPGKSHRLIGESTPAYMYWYNAPRRIWKYNPNIKLIVLLRNPVDRAYSHWNMEIDKRRDNVSFEEAIYTERERCRKVLPLQHRIFSYVDRGFYLEQLRRLWFFFPKDQVLILKSEYLLNKPNDALRDVCNFLNVGQFGHIETKSANSRTYVSEINDKERKYLQFTFEHEIRGLERVLGWDCSDWL